MAKKKPTVKPLPRTIYVRRDHDPNDRSAEWLSAGETPDEFSEKGGEVRVGMYQLVRVVKVRNQTTIVPEV